MSKKRSPAPAPNSRGTLVRTIGDLKAELLENEMKTEAVLKDDASSRADRQSALEKQINNCYRSRCRLDDCLEKLKRDYSAEPPNTLTVFISNVSDVAHGLGPEALILIASAEVGPRYSQLLRRLELNDSVTVVAIGDLTAAGPDVVSDVPMGHVNAALVDGSDDELARLAGSRAVLTALRLLVSEDRLFYVRGDAHRDACFQHVVHRAFARRRAFGAGCVYPPQ